MRPASISKALATSALAASLVTACRPQYVQVNLVSDAFQPGLRVDKNLVNPWGMAQSPTGPLWVANNGTSTATVYDGNGDPVPSGAPLVVQILPDGSAPTGQVFNGTGSFVVSSKNGSGPARFIFVTEAGTIAGWNPAVDPNRAVMAPVVMPVRALAAPIYKGAALAMPFSGPRLYAADFRNAKVDVFNGNWVWIGTLDAPKVPEGLSPFNVEVAAGMLVVTYAMADAAHEDDVPGPGLGMVDLYTLDGKFVRRLASGGSLNAPWGVAFAQPGFTGTNGSALLVGNFGDGRINAFDLNGRWLGPIRDFNGKAIAIEGLWDIAFGNGHFSTAPHNLYFTAGPEDENHGLFGFIAVADTF